MMFGPGGILESTHLLVDNIIRSKQQLCVLIGATSLAKDRSDKVFWSHDLEVGYNAKAGYILVANRNVLIVAEPKSAKGLNLNWLMEVPFSVRAFIWRCFLNRNPTKVQLVHRGIPLSLSDSLCMFCSETEETFFHLFFICLVSVLVWNGIADWCGVVQDSAVVNVCQNYL